jgi:hypothetical protein
MISAGRSNSVKAAAGLGDDLRRQNRTNSASRTRSRKQPPAEPSQEEEERAIRWLGFTYTIDHRRRKKNARVGRSPSRSREEAGGASHDWMRAGHERAYIRAVEGIMRTWQRWGGEMANYWRVFFLNLPKMKDGEEGWQIVGVALNIGC